MNKQQHETVKQALLKTAVHHQRAGFWYGVILGFIIGFGVGAVIVYNWIDQVVVVAVGPKTEV